MQINYMSEKMMQFSELKEGPEIAAKLIFAISTNVLSVKHGTEYCSGVLVYVDVCQCFVNSGRLL